ncbi:CopG family transcriptional regulator [Candidatus Pyrohabitans sp.]
MGDKENIKRIQITFTKEQWEIIENMKGEMGNTDAEIVRNIVIAWLSEKSIISEIIKNKFR